MRSAYYQRLSVGLRGLDNLCNHLCAGIDGQSAIYGDVVEPGIGRVAIVIVPCIVETLGVYAAQQSLHVLLVWMAKLHARNLLIERRIHQHAKYMGMVPQDALCAASDDDAIAHVGCLLNDLCSEYLHRIAIHCEFRALPGI